MELLKWEEVRHLNKMLWFCFKTVTHFSIEVKIASLSSGCSWRYSPVRPRSRKLRRGRVVSSRENRYLTPTCSFCNPNATLVPLAARRLAAPLSFTMYKYNISFKTLINSILILVLSVYCDLNETVSDLVWFTLKFVSRRKPKVNNIFSSICPKFYVCNLKTPKWLVDIRAEGYKINVWAIAHFDSCSLFGSVVLEYYCSYRLPHNFYSVSQIFVICFLIRLTMLSPLFKRQ